MVEAQQIASSSCSASTIHITHISTYLGTIWYIHYTVATTKSNRQARCLAPCQCHSRGEYYSIVVGKRRLFFPETKALDRRNNRFDATRGTRGPTRFSYLNALFAAIQGLFSSRWYVASVFVILIGIILWYTKNWEKYSEEGSSSNQQVILIWTAHVIFEYCLVSHLFKFYLCFKYYISTFTFH